MNERSNVVAMSRKSCLLVVVFLIILPVLILAGAGAFGFYSYTQQKAALTAKINALPGFDSEEKGKELAAELKMNYPVKKPEKDLKQLKAQINKLIKSKVSQKFSSRYKSNKILYIIRNFSTAKPGKKISFQLIRRANQSSGDIIRGVYKGKEPGGVSEELIVVDNNRYPYSRVIPDNRYLFNERESKVIQEKYIKEFKDKFEKDRKEYAAKLKGQYEDKIIRKAGYYKNSEGKWVPEFEAFEKALAKEKKAFDKKRKSKVKKLIEKSKVFGFIKIEFSKSELKSMMTGDDDKDDSDVAEVDAEEKTDEKEEVEKTVEKKK
jgi:hypothetical protein